MIVVTPLLGAATRTRSPFGFALIDDFTQAAPLGQLVAHLDELVGTSWVETSFRATITASSVLAFPGLGRHAAVANEPPKQYRLRLDAELYRPFYRASSAGIIMSVPPYNDAEPPTLPVPTFGQMLLLPAFHYSYPWHVPVLRGEVVDTNAVPVADALVVDTMFGERTLTDERGAFSLPLRHLAPGLTDTIHVSDQLNRVGNLSFTLPAALSSGVLIPIA